MTKLSLIPELISHYGIEPYLKGLAVQNIQEIDHLIIDGVRNLLFDPPAGTDLARRIFNGAVTMDWPITIKPALISGSIPVNGFTHFPADAGVKLREAYEGESEQHRRICGSDFRAPSRGQQRGELVHAVLVDQFTRLRDGDRFYYENIFGGVQLNAIRNTQLSDIIRRNTTLENIQDEVFRDERSAFVYCATEGLQGLDSTLRFRGGELQLVDNRGISCSHRVRSPKHPIWTLSFFSVARKMIGS